MDQELFHGHKSDKYSKENIYCWTIRAGKRTYFIDAKNSPKNGLHLSIAESRKCVDQEGKTYYDKHKIYLYQADFERFVEGLHKVIEYIENYRVEDSIDDIDHNREEMKQYTDVEFDDLEGMGATG